MKPKWHDVVDQVLGEYTCDTDEIAQMVSRLKTSGHYALARGQWLYGDTKMAVDMLVQGLQEANYD